MIKYNPTRIGLINSIFWVSLLVLNNHLCLYFLIFFLFLIFLYWLIGFLKFLKPERIFFFFFFEDNDFFPTCNHQYQMLVKTSELMDFEFLRDYKFRRIKKKIVNCLMLCPKKKATSLEYLRLVVSRPYRQVMTHSKISLTNKLRMK